MRLNRARRAPPRTPAHGRARSSLCPPRRSFDLPRHNLPACLHGFDSGVAYPERLEGIVRVDDGLIVRSGAADKVLELRLEGALSDDNVGALACILRPAEEPYRRRSRAVRGHHSPAPRHLYRIVERPWIAPLALEVSYGAALEAQRHQCVVETVVLVAQDAPSVDPLDLAKRPAQKVEVVDDQVEEHPAAHPPVGVPVVPTGQEGRAAAGARHADGAELPGVYHLLDADILREEADDVTDEEPFLAPFEGLDNRFGIFEAARYGLL